LLTVKVPPVRSAGARVPPRAVGVEGASRLEQAGGVDVDPYGGLRDLAARAGQLLRGIFGEHDILLRVRTHDAASLRDVVLTRLQEMPEVRATQTVLIFEELEPGGVRRTGQD
jgi:hypothetical protein